MAAREKRILNYQAKGFDEARIWYDTRCMNKSQVFAHIVIRLKALGYAYMCDNPFAYALGQALLVKQAQQCNFNGMPQERNEWT